MPFKQVSGIKCSQKYRQKQERRFVALKVYNMYKNKLSLSNVNNAKIWEKIIETVRRKCLLSKGEYGLQQFHSQMLSLKCEYERKRNLKSYVKSPYLKEAQLAFEDSEFPGKFLS